MRTYYIMLFYDWVPFSDLSPVSGFGQGTYLNAVVCSSKRIQLHSGGSVLNKRVSPIF